jgi:hypothetical protein
MKKAGVKYPKNGKKWGTIGKEIFKAEAEVITKQALNTVCGPFIFNVLSCLALFFRLFLMEHS